MIIIVLNVIYTAHCFLYDYQLYVHLIHEGISRQLYINIMEGKLVIYLQNNCVLIRLIHCYFKVLTSVFVCIFSTNVFPLPIDLTDKYLNDKSDTEDLKSLLSKYDKATLRGILDEAGLYDVSHEEYAVVGRFS